MAIHGPRKIFKKKSTTEKTFYDMLTEEQRTAWKDMLKTQFGLALLDYFPEYLIKDAINRLHRRIKEEECE